MITVENRLKSIINRFSLVIVVIAKPSHINSYCYANGNDLTSFHMKTINKSYKNQDHE